MNQFVLFGNTHILTMILIISIAVFLPKIYKTKSQESKALMSKIIAGIVFAHIITSPYKDLYLLENPYFKYLLLFCFQNETPQTHQDIVPQVSVY